MAMNEYEATVKTTKILEDAKVEKFGAIGVTLFMITLVISITVYSLQETKGHVEFANAGLEQCKTKDDSASQSIWVRDCSKYLKDLYETRSK